MKKKMLMYFGIIGIMASLVSGCTRSDELLQLDDRWAGKYDSIEEQVTDFTDSTGMSAISGIIEEYTKTDDEDDDDDSIIQNSLSELISSYLDEDEDEEEDDDDTENTMGDIVSSGISHLTSALEVHYIDVGQGDCILIISDDDAMLIDAGDTNCGSKVRKYLADAGVESLDYFICTHPDADHIGGAASVVSNVDIDQILMPDYQKETKTYDNLMNEINFKSLDYTIPEPGQTYYLGEAEFIILGPINSYDDANNNSIVIKLMYDDVSYLFTGDCENEEEEDIITYCENNDISLNCDVLKVGHHGSSTSSGKDFIEKASPEYAVISCGAGNDYGHPHEETLETLKENDVSVFRTDEQGTIISYTDGQNIWWNNESSETWAAGDAA